MFVAFLVFFFISISFCAFAFVFAKAALREFCSSSRLKGVWFPDNFFVIFYQLSLWQESIPVGCVPLAFPVPAGWGWVLGRPPPLWMQALIPLDADPLPWSSDLRCMLGSQPLPHMDRMTDTCKNIALPQTSFAGGKKLKNTNQDLNN